MNIIHELDVFKNFMDMVPIGIFWKDTDRRFLGANQMFLEYYALHSVDEILGKTDEDMGWHIDPEPYKSVELRVIGRGETIRNVPGQCIVKGRVRNIMASKSPLIVDGRIEGLVGYFLDVTDEQAEIDRLSNLSQTDDLTGLLNRRAYGEVIQQYENQYKKDGTDFVLYMMDLDRFKSVNDEFGHEFGNLILKSIAKSLTDVAAADSVLFRYGGDEFVMVHQYKDHEDIERIAHKLQSAVAHPRNIDGITINMTTSIGYAVYSETMYLTSLIEEADHRMYEMKRERFPSRYI